MSADVCLAAMMPASRAVWSGSPFLIAPARICRSAARDIVIRPRATASRAVTALSETSTMCTRPRGPTCESAPASRVFLLMLLVPSPCARKNDSDLERDGQVHALQLDVGGHLQPAGRKVQDRLDAGGDHGVDDGLRRLRGHGDHGDRNLQPAHDRAQLADVVDRHAAARRMPDLVRRRVEHRRDLEPFIAEPRIVREREPEVAGAHDRHPDGLVDAENLAQVAPQLLDVVADAADPELAEVREILPNLRRVEVKLLGERPRGHRPHALRRRARSGSAGRPTAGWS